MTESKGAPGERCRADDAAVLAVLQGRAELAARVRDGWHRGMFASSVAKDAKLEYGRAYRALQRLEQAGLAQRKPVAGVAMWVIGS